MARYTITLTESAEATILNYLKSVTGVKKVERVDEPQSSIPAWHDQEVAMRLKEYLDNPNDVVDFDGELKKLEKEL